MSRLFDMHCCQSAVLRQRRASTARACLGLFGEQGMSYTRRDAVGPEKKVRREGGSPILEGAGAEATLALRRASPLDHTRYV